MTTLQDLDLHPTQLVTQYDSHVVVNEPMLCGSMPIDAGDELHPKGFETLVSFYDMGQVYVREDLSK